MNALPVRYPLPELLQRAGARLVSNRRADCPKCSGRRTISFNEETFFCHHAGCAWKGNSFTLAKELGLVCRLTAEEYRSFQWTRQKAHEKAKQLYQRARNRRLKLCDHYRRLMCFVDRAHEKQNPQDESAWSRSARVYRILPWIHAELAILEDSPPGELITFLKFDPVTRRQRVAEVIHQGGIQTDEGKFIGFH